MANLTTSANVDSLLQAADYAAMRTLLNVEDGADVTDATNVAAAGALMTSALGTGVETALGVNVGSAGAPVVLNGAGGTPSSITLTNGTGLPVATGISGLGTGVATALAVNVGSAGAPIVFNGDAGTPSALVGTNISGTAASLTAGNVTTNANLTGPVTSVGNTTTIADAELAAIAGLTSAANKVPYFTGSGTAGLLDLKDEDDMTSDSATAVPTQQSVKAYVDTELAAVVVNNDGTTTYGFALSDETADLETGDGALTFEWSTDFTLTKIVATCNEAPATTGIILDVYDVDATQSVLATPASDLTIAASSTFKELATFNGGTTYAFTKADRVRVDIDQVGTGTLGDGLKIYFIGYANGAGHRESIEVPLTGPAGTLTAAEKFYARVPYAGTLEKLVINCQTAPTTTNPAFDLSYHASWGSTPVTMLSGNLSLTAGAFEATDSSPSTTAMAAGAVLEVEVVTIDSGGTCADATATIYYLRD